MTRNRKYTIVFDSIIKSYFIYLRLNLIAYSSLWKKQKNRNREVEHAQDLGVSRDFPEGRK